MSERYTITFTDVSAERMALIVAAGYATPDKGRVDRADPEVFPTKRSAKARIIGNGVIINLSIPSTSYTDEQVYDTLRRVLAAEFDIEPSKRHDAPHVPAA